MLVEIGALLDKEHFLAGILPKSELNMLLMPPHQSPEATAHLIPAPHELPVSIVPTASVTAAWKVTEPTCMPARFTRTC